MKQIYARSLSYLHKNFLVRHQRGPRMLSRSEERRRGNYFRLHLLVFQTKRQAGPLAPALKVLFNSTQEHELGGETSE